MQPRSLGPTDQATTSHARVASLDVYTPRPALDDVEEHTILLEEHAVL